MFKTLANAWKIEELRKKLLFTLMIILLYRIGVAITVPFVSAELVSEQVAVLGGIGGLFSTLSSGFEYASLFALGVSPYITASIVVQLLSVAIPSLERLAKQGEEGKQKITVITRYITIGISLIMAIGYYFMISGALIKDSWYVAFLIVACFCAGSALVMWLAEKINEKGIGNGISIILFANIVSRGLSILNDFIGKVENIYYGDPNIAGALDTYESYESIYTSLGLTYDPVAYKETLMNSVENPWGFRITSILVLLLTTIGILALIWFVVFISDSERRIPVQYAKKVVGRKMYGGRNTNLPLKVNMAGVMPVIFANAILSIPGMIFQFINTSYDEYASSGYSAYYTLDEYCLATTGAEASFVAEMDAFFSNTASWFFLLMTFILILAFAYFYVSISFNPVEVAGNLQQNGGSIPGIRPGKPTAMFIKKVLSKVTFIGALCLSVVAILPTLVYLILNGIGGIELESGTSAVLTALQGRTSMIGDFVNCGTSIIIVVGVVLETVRDMEAQMTMRHYKGFLD